ncbi:MAG: hypothetical protein U1E27_06210 [Kiritimatiellia bacterium]|nr:hypothetical protein [Kiritimatiellia bacterium]
MNRFFFFVLLLAVHFASAEPEGRVTILDGGWRESVIGPGAPEAVRGLLGASQEIEMNTGVVRYGLRYAAAIDPSLGGEARPGEGYIGMSKPSSCNWYSGGFLDPEIDGRSVGRTRIQSFSGHRADSRGYVDYLFDTTQAVVRIRFVASAGGDVLFAQIGLEPKVDISSLMLNLRNYPSGFVSTAERHIRTPVRDLIQGQSADLDVVEENRIFYYDAILDQGVAHGGQTGVGPCAVLWEPRGIRSAHVSVGSYAVQTRIRLDPGAREFRLVFMDYAGRGNADAGRDLDARAAALRQELATMDFRDPRILRSLPESTWAAGKAQRAGLPEEQAKDWPLEAWAREWAVLQSRMKQGQGGIQAERQALERVEVWTRALIDLHLQALLHGI